MFCYKLAMAKATIIRDADDTAIARALHHRLAAALETQPGPVAITVPGGMTPFPILARLLAAARQEVLCFT